MVCRLRLVSSPNATLSEPHSYPVAEAGAYRTITSARVGGGLRTYVDGPGGGLVFVERDDGLVCGISMHDLKLEPDDARRV